jgi:hypothetical protein
MKYIYWNEQYINLNQVSEIEFNIVEVKHGRYPQFFMDILLYIGANESPVVFSVREMYSYKRREMELAKQKFKEKLEKFLIGENRLFNVWDAMIDVATDSNLEIIIHE